MSNLDDISLLKRLRSGDEASLRLLIDDLYGTMLRTAMTFVPSRAVAEEVVQETWLAVIKGLNSFEGRSSLKTWIFRILINQSKSKGIKEAKSLPGNHSTIKPPSNQSGNDLSLFSANGSWNTPQANWENSTPESLLNEKEVLELIEKTIEQLPATQKMVLILRDIEGLDSKEICNILDIKKTNLRVLLHRARSKLHKALKTRNDEAQVKK